MSPQFWPQDIRIRAAQHLRSSRPELGLVPTRLELELSRLEFELSRFVSFQLESGEIKLFI